MAAKFIDDERLVDENEFTDPSAVEQDDHGLEAHDEPTDDRSEVDELPDKYKGKSVAELARMHQEAEKLLGRQSSEVGELRKTVDAYIQTQLSQQQAPQEDDDEVDFFVDPDKAIARAIERHPKVRQAEEMTANYQRQTALARLQQRHPDMQEILQDNSFGEWIQASKVRTQLYLQADQQFDHDAADELFTLWKERKGITAQAAEAEKQSRKQKVKSASTGNVTGNPDSRGRKIYRRADIIKLMKTDPERYASLSDEIMRAYAEGRVK